MTVPRDVETLSGQDHTFMQRRVYDGGRFEGGVGWRRDQMSSPEPSSADHIEPLGGSTRILVVDDCRLRREYLADELAGSGFAVTESWDLDSFRAALEQRTPEVLVIDAGTSDSKRILEQSVEAGLASRVVVFGLTPDDEDTIVSLAASGVSGYHLRSDSLEDLLTFIGRVSAGDPGCSSGVSAILLRRLSRIAAERQGSSDIAVLTSRERDVLNLLELGLSNREISARLHIATHTVKKHVHNVLKKVGAKSRSEAAAIGLSGRLERFS